MWSVCRPALLPFCVCLHSLTVIITSCTALAPDYFLSWSLLMWILPCYPQVQPVTSFVVFPCLPSVCLCLFPDQKPVDTPFFSCLSTHSTSVSQIPPLWFYIGFPLLFPGKRRVFFLTGSRGFCKKNPGIFMDQNMSATQNRKRFAEAVACWD